jgi:phage-related protein
VIQALLGAVTLVVQSRFALLAACIQSAIHPIAPLVQILGTRGVAIGLCRCCAIVQAGVDAITLVVQSLFSGLAALIQALVDALAAIVQSLVGAITAILSHRRNGDQCEQGRSQYLYISFHRLFLGLLSYWVDQRDSLQSR